MSRPPHVLTPYERSLVRIAVITSFFAGLMIGMAIAILVWTL